LAIPVAALIGKAVLGALGKKQDVTEILESAHGTLSQKSVQILGYNFVNLFVQLFIYFALAFAFAKIMEGIIFFRGGFVIIANLLGIKIPNKEQFPQSLRDLFDGGISGFKFWDVVKVVAVIIVIAEFVVYLQIREESGKKVSPITIAVFLMIGLFLTLTSIPALLQRIKGTFVNKEQLV